MQCMQLASGMAAAAKSAAGGGKAAADAAAAAAFDASLDVAVAIGWANVERFCHDNFVREASSAPAGLAPALHLMAGLYGMTRVEKDATFFLAAGVMDGADLCVRRRDLVTRNTGVAIGDLLC